VPRRPDIDAAAIHALVVRVFPGETKVRWERTPEGSSTQVYRVDRGDDTFYLRVAEESHEDLGVDAQLFEQLRRQGIKAPKAIFVDRLPPPVDRSVLVMTAVAGQSLAVGADEATARAATREAGRDLALLNMIDVQGFGWIRRDFVGWPLHAELSSYPAFVTSDLPRPWPGVMAELFSVPRLGILDKVIADEQARSPRDGRLVHGDFDPTAIFVSRGRFSGFIDFGEIRGAEPLFDLGHFLLHDGAVIAWSLFDELVDGYREVVLLPDDFGRAVRASAALLGLRQLARWLRRDNGPGLHTPQVQERAERIGDLLDHLANRNDQ
jgi:aminoglycoside phosphotransferase (APT) family kinase protein